MYRADSSKELGTTEDESGCLMAESCSPWSSPAPEIVDALTKSLVELRRWRLDGASLRRLNKRWYIVMNQKTVRIRPHDCRRISQDDDVKSLLKFPFLASLDVTPFVTARAVVACETCYVLDRKARTRVAQYAEKVHGLIEILSQIPSLTHLEVGSEVIRMEWEHRSSGGEALWTGMTGISSLAVFGERNPKLYGDTALNVAWVEERSEVRCDRKELEVFLSEFSGLKRLEAYVHNTWNPEAGTILDRLESVKIHAAKSVRWIGRLTGKSFLFSAAMEDPAPQVLEILPSLKKLHSFSLSLSSPESLTSPFLSLLLERLTVLDLRMIHRPALKLPDSFFCSVRRLQCLQLRHAVFSGQALIQNLPHLISLTVAVCWLTDGLSFLSQKNKLQSLALHIVRCENGPCIELPLEIVKMPDLQSLSLAPVQDDRLLEAVGKLTKLEVLSLAIGSRSISDDGMKQLEKLPNLRMMSMDFYSSTSHLPSIASLRLLTRLEWLCLTGFKATVETERYVSEMKNKAPRLILEQKKKKDDFCRFVAGHFI